MMVFDFVVYFFLFVVTPKCVSIVYFLKRSFIFYKPWIINIE